MLYQCSTTNASSNKSIGSNDKSQKRNIFGGKGGSSENNSGGSADPEDLIAGIQVCKDKQV